MQKKRSFIVSLLAVFMLITSPGKSTLKFQDILEAPRTNHPVPNSPEESLINSYKRLRAKLTLDTFDQRSREFYTFIFDPIDSTNIVNQNNYIDELIDLKEKLSTVHPLFESYFKNYVTRLDHRLDLARIDQQIFNVNGIRRSFNHPNIHINMRPLLNALTGKIFLITQKDTLVEDVSYSGSGMFMSLNFNNIQNLDNNQNYPLNSVLTCSHVLEAQESEHIMGAYFVPNDSLDAQTGFPVDLINPVNDKNGLINFLRTHNNSFQINSYKFKRRDLIGNGNFTANYSLTETKPQYWESEDIAIGNVALKLNQNFRNYQNNIVTNFDTITNNQPLNFNNGEQYFAIGYPVCNQYDPLPLNLHPQLQLIEDMGFSPLFVTSSISQGIGGMNPNPKPNFNNGVIKHEAPTSKGMSGGLLIRVANGQIEVFGSIGGKSDNDEYEACY